MVDLSLKPTLASYPFRVQPEERPPITALHEAEDGDDALLAMIDHQGELAKWKMKMGRVRQACHTLQKAYNMVESYVDSFPLDDPVPPAAVLAAATVRLGLCVCLSSIGRHTQALDEAKMAAREMDKVWRSLFLASSEQEEATADGDMTRPAPPFRDALRNPPQWLERAVETAVQARHAIAIELEYEAGPQSRSPQSSMFGGSSIAAVGADAGVSEETLQSGELAEDEVPDPVPASEAFTVQEQIGRLHREGVQLARQLLPPGHQVRNRAELAMEEWLQRTGGDGQPNLPPTEHAIVPKLSRRKMVGHVVSGSTSQITTASAPALAPLPPSKAEGRRASKWTPEMAASLSTPDLTQSLPRILRKRTTDRLPVKEYPGATWPSGSMQTASTASLDAFPSESSTLRFPGSMSLGEFTSQMSAGEVGVGSCELPELEKKKSTSSSSPRKGKTKSNKEKSKEGGQSVDFDNGSSPRSSAVDGQRSGKPKTIQQKQKEAALLLAQKDPFEDWRRNMVDENQMGHMQRQLRSDEGLDNLRKGLWDEAKRFKFFWLKDLEAHHPDALYDNRILFGSSGIKTQQLRKKEEDAFKKNNWIETEEGAAKRATKSNLFQYFGTSPGSGDEPKLSDLSKLLSKSHTHGANLERCVREEKKRQEAERARIRKEKLSGGVAAKKKHPEVSKPVGKSSTGPLSKSQATESAGEPKKEKKKA